MSAAVIALLASQNLMRQQSSGGGYGRPPRDERSLWDKIRGKKAVRHYVSTMSGLSA